MTIYSMKESPMSSFMLNRKKKLPFTYSFSYWSNTVSTTQIIIKKTSKNCVIFFFVYGTVKVTTRETASKYEIVQFYGVLIFTHILIGSVFIFRTKKNNCACFNVLKKIATKYFIQTTSRLFRGEFLSWHSFWHCWRFSLLWFSLRRIQFLKTKNKQKQNNEMIKQKRLFDWINAAKTVIYKSIRTYIFCFFLKKALKTLLS